MTSGLGKVILLGEHAVVHGHPALAGAIDRGVRCSASPDQGDGQSEGVAALSIPAWSLEVRSGDDHPVAAALAAILERLGLAGRALAIRGESDLPPAAGLGSSAALSVALARCLSHAAGLELAGAELEEVAGLAELRFHRRPSGIDVALAARGGLGLYSRAAGLEPLDVAPIDLAVGLSGERRETGAMVAQVAARLARDPAATGDRLHRLGEAARAGARALAAGDLRRLGELMDEAHRHLAALELSTPALDQLASAARSAGALGAKLTGAGGGGAVIALAPGREGQILHAWRAAGFDGFACAAGASPGL